MTKDYGITSTTSEDVSTLSGQSSQESQPEGSGESLKVTITVISIDGVVAKKYQPKSKLPTKLKKTEALSLDARANIIASFSQDCLSKQNGNDFFTHVPSLPIETPGSSCDCNPVIQWPNTQVNEKQALSTVQQKRHFQREKTSNYDSERRFVPQMSPINISISRHGKLIKLGKANLFISGEERGDVTINIPIFPSTRDNSSSKKNSVKKVKGSKKSSNPMMRIKGDNLQFGLKSYAMLRVLVSVDDLCDDRSEESIVASEPECVSFEDDNDGDDYECSFDDDSVEEHDSYEDYIKAASEANELRSLRQQLRNSEDLIQNLQAKCDKATITQQDEIDRLTAELQQATQNCETLLQELNQSKSQSDVVPFLETRVNEFMEELKKKDTEIECLRDEVTEIRKYYKYQVNTLLWDSEDPDNTKAANWKAAIGSAALKATRHIRDREFEASGCPQDEEKKSDNPIEESEDAPLFDNQNMNETNQAVNWKTAILRARQHILERGNKQKEDTEEIVVASKEDVATEREN